MDGANPLAVIRPIKMHVKPRWSLKGGDCLRELNNVESKFCFISFH